MSQFLAESVLPFEREAVFAYHERPGALDRLLPPWQNVEIAKRSKGIDIGEQVELRIKSPVGMKVTWLAKHTKYTPPSLFEDIQLSGPMKSWVHQHVFEQIGPKSTLMKDCIDYTLPGGWLGKVCGDAFFRNELRRMFRYRHAVTLDDLSLQQKFSSSPLRIAVSGSTGLVGSHLVALLRTAGHIVIPMVRPGTDRRKLSADGVCIEWSPQQGLVRPEQSEGLDAVVHLAGKSIGDARWSPTVKQELRDSRVAATELLAKQLAELKKPPQVFVSCSAIGIYGSRGAEELSESTVAGSGFLADVAVGWEKAADPLRAIGSTRVVHPRLGIVLHPRHAALAKLLTPIRMGLGGTMGSGRQYWSWVSIDDCVGAIYHLLMDSRAEGAVNIVSPEPMTNRDFIRTIAKVVCRPALFPVPASLLKVLLGEMAGPLLLDSCRVVPGKLERLGYSFRHSNLITALRYLLGL